MSARKKKAARPGVFGILADGLDASVDGRGWGKKHEAARRLADAAPAMRKALEDLLNYFAEWEKDYPDDAGRFDKARAALELAGDWGDFGPIRVRVKVEGGIAEAYHVPPGIAVEFIDHDVEGTSEEENDLACRCEEGGGTYHSHWTEDGDTQEAMRRARRK